MSNDDLSAVSSGGRGRGRPSLGTNGSSVPIRLSEEERTFAGALGQDVFAKGVRRAIKAAGVLGLDAVVRLAGPDETEDDPTNRGPGRPRIGKPTPIRLTDDEIKVADSMGKVAEKDKAITALGVRRALRACSRLGIEATMRLIN